MSEELQELASKLGSVCENLDRLASPDYAETVGKHTRAEIHSQISGARDQGSRVSPYWSKPALVAAYIAIKQRQFEQERARLFQQLEYWGVSRAHALAFIKQQVSKRAKTGKRSWKSQKL